MKNYKWFIISFMFGIFFTSCQYDTEITITNDIPETEISFIRLGDITFSSSLEEGESATRIISGHEKDFPISGNISFIMDYNNKKIHLVTENTYSIYKDQKVEITIDESIIASNPIN